MGKGLNYKGKLNILLITYSFFITLTVLVFGFLSITNINKPTQATDKILVEYSSEEITLGMSQGLVMTRVEELPNKSFDVFQMQREYSKDLVTKGIIVMLFVFLIIMMLSIGISKYISKKVINPIEKMAAQLPNLINGEIEEINDNIFSYELKGIKNALTDSSKKVRKLLKEANSINSYITHEQKNTLAVLRAKIQLGERDELISLVDRMSSSLDDILALNATESVEHNEEVDLALVCAEAVDEYRKIYKNIELEFDEENLPMILGRELWIYRAVCNLIENAIKYGDNSKITVHAYIKNGSSIICVEDRGKGVDKDILDKIFSFKYRGENLKKDGYGIGLSLVNQITHLCDGVTYIESEEGKGAKFYMAFKALTLD
ncbi:MAG: sensor histidine kinase [Clostridium sp.]